MSFLLKMPRRLEESDGAPERWVAKDVPESAIVKFLWPELYEMDSLAQLIKIWILQRVNAGKITEIMVCKFIGGTAEQCGILFNKEITFSVSTNRIKIW